MTSPRNQDLKESYFFCSSLTNDSDSMAEYKLKIRPSDSEPNFEQTVNSFFLNVEIRFDIAPRMTEISGLPAWLMVIGNSVMEFPVTLAREGDHGGQRF